MHLRTYFVNLTSRRAVHLFIVCLTAGVICIVAGVGLPWTPAFLVALYGGILFYTSKVYLVSHAEMTNNSPYFLGFLFFLISLVKTFWGLSFASADAELEQIVRQLGGALLATVVGLPFRQLLFAYSPAQADQDFFFRTLEEELRRSATEFKRSQAELVQLVQEFVEARKGLFAAEEKASRRYISSLERAIGLFENNFANYPTVISSALSNCAESLRGLKEKSRELSDAAQAIDPQQITTLVAQFGTVKEHSIALASGLSALQTAVKRLEEQTAGLPATVKSHLVVAQSEFDEIRRQLRARLEAIDSDIQAIDKVLSDFVTVSQERIEAVR